MPTFHIGPRTHLQPHTSAPQNDCRNLILLGNLEQIALAPDIVTLAINVLTPRLAFLLPELLLLLPDPAELRNRKDASVLPTGSLILLVSAESAQARPSPILKALVQPRP